jgi:hypothetical protein
MKVNLHPQMKNTHLEHLEDVILNKGSMGGHEVIEILRSLGKSFSSNQSDIHLTTKWDGSPAIVCGINPENGKFFVGTKSVFNKVSPKICYSQKDIEDYYSGELAKKLSDCLTYLQRLGITGVVQGDLLFTDDKEIEIINGEEVIKFTPNTITYTVPVGSDIADKISKSKLGMVFHTKYEGKNLSDMKASFGYDISKLNKDSEVYVTSALMKTLIPFSAFELKNYGSAIQRAEGSLKQASNFLDLIQGQGESKYIMAAVFKQFFNSYVRQFKVLANAKDVAADFALYYMMLLDKEIATKKTTLTKNKYIKIKDEGLKFISSNQRSIYMTVASYMNLQAAKNIIIRQLEKVKTIGTFLKTDNGYKVTSPEGFVAIKHGSAIKLVDRFEFSYNNFNSQKSWNKK